MTERISLKKFSFSSKFGEQYPREFISLQGALKVAEDEQHIKIAVVEDSPAGIYHFLEGYHIPKKVSFCRVSKADFASFIGETTDIKPGVPESRQDKSRLTLDSITQDAPVVNIINSICIEAIRLEASDIHIEAQADAIHIRYRIDGVMRLVKKIEKNLFNSISNRIKIMANMNTMEQRLPQDGRMTVSIENTDIDLRVSIIPVTGGESIVLRIFNKSTKVLSLDQLGFNKNDLKKIQGAIAEPYGLILASGPTGSGKTTTLHALVHSLPVEDLKIVTIEDPVEQLIPGVSQVQINEEIKLTFESMLRRVLRQDPNVIMVGEIRDTPTAELALRSALTGHLIFSTIHTNDSISVIRRLENMGLEPYLIAAVLHCSIAQRLVRKLCPRCKTRKSAGRDLKKSFAKFGISGEEIFEAGSCESCDFTGYRGRTVISEVLCINPEIEELIIKRASLNAIGQAAARNGFIPMAGDALSKLSQGISSLEEIFREVKI